MPSALWSFGWCLYSKPVALLYAWLKYLRQFDVRLSSTSAHCGNGSKRASARASRSSAFVAERLFRIFMGFIIACDILLFDSTRTGNRMLLDILNIASRMIRPVVVSSVCREFRVVCSISLPFPIFLWVKGSFYSPPLPAGEYHIIAVWKGVLWNGDARRFFCVFLHCLIEFCPKAVIYNL